MNVSICLREDKQRFVTCPQVQQVYYCHWRLRFLLVINVRDMAEYEALTRELFFASGNIKSSGPSCRCKNAKQEMTVIIE
ncbi:regulator for leucine (or lrp) regulon and high-affinity branched-chain amino acid transport system [Klebsiella pneumoniae]|uniref:Regulator for leucine (Or lrp) regulon and high-affinity branched-chain amino acid transport system n=1 Tax=Klebsiella pneumoniae TaxID=573 RepID=A0A2X3EQV9_KLEPN|nr:regulator for leucine (or lrp) regulon and high-affinity branched-chain amino acid transport system [Klebsiella pneumoniae]